MNKAVLYLTLATCVAMLTGCDNVDSLRQKIKSLGYIYYETPLAQAGPGTLVMGGPKNLQFVTGPDTCFPREINGASTGLYYRDDTSIPETHYEATGSGNVAIKLINFMSQGNPMMEIGAGFSEVQKIDLKMDGVHVEYIDSIKLMHFYQHNLSVDCKTFLERVGFMIQALKVDRLTYEFYNKFGAKIELTLQGIKEILDIHADVKFEIVNQTQLVITTPKYIGYQLARLQAQDNGMAFFRATKTMLNKFVFKDMSIFPPVDPENGFDAFAAESSADSGIFQPVYKADEIDQHSVYRLK